MNQHQNPLITLGLQDPNLELLIKVTNFEYVNHPPGDPFLSLTKIIIGQQLSGKAAYSIFSRLTDLLGDNFDPTKVNEVSHDKLKQCGISNAKILYVKGLAKILIERPNYFYELQKYDAKHIIDTLCQIKGVGVWTASIFAMGTLGFMDIFPYGDSTLQRAIDTIYSKKVSREKIISNWSPYKTVACKILWNWVDIGMPNFR